jgi:hypothetical protein
LGRYDEVVFLEPFFPWYISHCRIFGAVPVTVRMVGLVTQRSAFQSTRASAQFEHLPGILQLGSRTQQLKWS